MIAAQLLVYSDESFHFPRVAGYIESRMLKEKIDFSFRSYRLMLIMTHIIKSYVTRVKSYTCDSCISYNHNTCGLPEKLGN